MEFNILMSHIKILLFKNMLFNLQGVFPADFRQHIDRLIEHINELCTKNV